ncbi:staphylocoagulase [Staphylococcus schweitzeri]|uniref:staphylocoagulase n=1 Tax=Staphylococcus schweitzeri TaxID=1654388 RepID=UPI000501F5E1|nr:staphylocoagulase precursor [Staphylococcus schweitzeri]
MKKQIISLGALAVASSLFTWDNKADAIVTKDYNGKSQVKVESKNGTPISNSYFWGKIDSLESQFSKALAIIEEYQYGEKEYKDAKDKFMDRILSEDQYLLEKKKALYEKYKEWYKKYKETNPTYPKMQTFHEFSLYNLTMEEYNEISKSLKDAEEEFRKNVSEIQEKEAKLKTYSEDEEEKATSEVYNLVSEIDTLVVTYYSDEKHREHAKELRAKLDLILGDADNPHKITNERIKKEMMDDLNSIIDDFFMETKQNRPDNITKYNPNIHNPKNNKENFDKLVEETKNAVKEAGESWKTKTVKSYGQAETKSKVVKEEKKVEESQSPKVSKQQEVKTTVDKAEVATQEVVQPLVKIPGGTIQGEIVQGQDFPTMEQKTPSLSDNYTQPSVALPTITGGSEVQNPVESTLKDVQEETNDIEVKPQVIEKTEGSQYGPRPQFNKTSKYVKYRDAGTGIREYNDGTYGYEARPRFNKPSETNAYNVTTHANSQVSYGARPTYKKASETNAYNVTTHANGQVSYGARPAQNKPSKTNAYNVTTHANGQVSYGARPTQNKPSETNAYNVTTYADGTATYGPRVTK